MSLIAQPYDTRTCELGEGPLWHPLRRQLFWFDILGCRLLSRDGDRPVSWQFDEHHSAAGWVDENTLMLASETGLWRFAIDTGARTLICPLEAEDASTRSNDGRADPLGGFWIGTMGKRAETGRGAIYRYYGGELRRLYSSISIPNSICFAADGRSAFFTDTKKGKIYHQALDSDGWPDGDPVLFIDPGSEGFNPDGSVVDAEGALWNAQWGASRVARYLPDGTLDRTVELAGAHASCPAFGGADLTTLYVTTAREGIDQPDPQQGQVYAIDLDIAGLPEPAVRL